MKNVKNGLRRVAALLLGAGLLALGGVCVFAEESETVVSAGPEQKLVSLVAGQDFDPAASEEECKAQLEQAFSQIAEYGMNVIDSGVAVLSMHSLWEVTNKADVYEAYKGYKAFIGRA